MITLGIQTNLNVWVHEKTNLPAFSSLLYCQFFILKWYQCLNLRLICHWYHFNIKNWLPWPSKHIIWHQNHACSPCGSIVMTFSRFGGHFGGNLAAILDFQPYWMVKWQKTIIFEFLGLSYMGIDSFNSFIAWKLLMICTFSLFYAKMAAILKKLNGTPIGGLFMKFSLPFSDLVQNLALKKLRSRRSTEISPTLLLLFKLNLNIKPGN